MKKKSGFKLFLKVFFIVILSICLLGIGGLCLYKYYKNPKPKVVKQVEVLDHLDEYGYSVSKNDSKLFISEFDIMKGIVNNKDFNEEEYVKEVGKLFIISLYSLDNRINKYDISASQFYFSDMVTMFEQKVMDTLYAHMIDNTYGDRKQTLPVVKEITVKSIEKTNYTLGKDKKDAYLVKLTWTYESNMGYDDNGSIILCKDGERKYSVVDYQPTLSPKYK